MSSRWVRSGSHSHPFATEGGHADFAPRNALESELLEYLRMRYDRVSFDEALHKNLRVMDQTAIALCRENRLPIIVFDMSVPGNLRRIAAGEEVGTRVGG